MSLRLLITADVHLGMKFAGYPEIQSELAGARFETLENVVKRANAEDCELFVVAGDLFDRVTVAKPDVIRAAQIIDGFEGALVVILPGNHDYYSMAQSDLWTLFKEASGDKTLLLERPQKYPLSHYDLDACLYAAPCEAKHSEENRVDWIRTQARDKGTRFHIGVAHGSLQGFSPDFDKKYYPMTPVGLLNSEMDLWLLGHTHLPSPAQPGKFDKIFYPGTPEPDGFDCDHEGRAWIIEIQDDKSIVPTSLTTGKYRFAHCMSSNKFGHFIS